MKKLIISGFLAICALFSYSQSYQIKFLAYGPGTVVPKPGGGTRSSLTGHMFIAFYKNGDVDVVKGFTPDEQSYWTQSELSDQAYLIDYATKSYTADVTSDKYNQAKGIQKSGYFFCFNDCVTYANNVATAIGLKTPSLSDAIAKPITYIEYLINNKEEAIKFINKLLNDYSDKEITRDGVVSLSGCYFIYKFKSSDGVCNVTVTIDLSNVILEEGDGVFFYSEDNVIKEIWLGGPLYGCTDGEETKKNYFNFSSEFELDNQSFINNNYSMRLKETIQFLINQAKK
ncbi:MAG: hypothetical protein M0R16_05410 [Bacteroidales bacterium]|jgi:hypothetical protein|nr:hypothetical protein [Bacteroidales bacterium]